MRRHLSLRPLPLSTEPESTDSEPEEEERQEDSQGPPVSVEIWKKQRRDREVDAFFDRQEQGREQESNNRSKKPRISDSEEEDSHKSVPRSEEYLHSQRHQRVSHHPNSQIMSGRAKTRKKRATSSAASSRSSKRGKANQKQDSDCDDDTATATSTLASGSDGSATNTKADRRRFCELTLKEMMRKAVDKNQKKSVESDMDKNVFSKAKHQLFKKTKFTHGDPYKKGADRTKLEMDSEWLLQHMNSDEYQKFEEFPDLEQEYIDCWIKLHKDTVRVGLNKKHNEIRGAIMDFFAKTPDDAGEDKWNPENLPETGKEMEDLLFNRGFGKKVPQEEREARAAKLAAVTDVVMPKVRKSEARRFDLEAALVVC